MTALRISMTVLASIIGAALVLAVVAAVGIVAAMSTGHDVQVPGLVEVTVGSGQDLASASAGRAVAVWFAAVTVLFLGLGLLRLRSRQHDA